jgi:hypothetical protein
MWLSAAEVARIAVEGMEQDKAVVIPGFANRVGARLGHSAPRSLLVPMLARQHPSLK